MSMIKTLEKISKNTFENIMPHKETLKKIYQNFNSKLPRTVYNDKDHTTITTIPIVHKITDEIQAILTVRANADSINSTTKYYWWINILNFTAIIVFFSH